MKILPERMSLWKVGVFLGGILIAYFLLRIAPLLAIILILGLCLWVFVSSYKIH
jgi:hypothetical protein